MAFTHILIVVIAAIGLTIFAERRNVQAPLLLAAVGFAASMVPGVPEVTLNPNVILSLLVPPLLYSAALEFSFFSFMRRLGSILNLGVLLVVATTASGGALVSWLLPTLSLPLAFVLAAAVAPPDAVSAVSIGRRLGLPDGMMTILKGESLINDAAALTLFSAAAAAATGGHTIIDNGILNFLYAAFAALVVGIVLAQIVHAIRSRLENPSLVTALAIITPFAAYGIAEELQASGVVAVVFAGFTLGHKAVEMPFAGRMQEREVWRVADTLLEAFAFAYMGLQFRFAVEHATRSGYSLDRLMLAATALLMVVVTMRCAWIFGAAGSKRLLRTIWSRSTGQRPIPAELTWRENLVLAWAGMRGVVTLAAAGGAPLVTIEKMKLPGAEAIVPIAFSVAMATLLLHGVTLPWLIRWLGVENASDLRRREFEHRRARVLMRRAADAVLANLESGEVGKTDLLFSRLMIERMQPITDDDALAGMTAEPTSSVSTLLDTANAVLVAQRKALVEERDAERIDDETVRHLLAAIDMEQAVIVSRREQLAAVSSGWRSVQRQG